MKVGIVGNGMIVKLALQSLKSIDIKVSAIYARSKEKAQALAEEYHIENVYDNYDEFLNDASYDTVYIGLINSLHYEYSKQALLAHKHVICEKPFTSNDQEARELINLAKENQVYLFEAIMSRYSQNLQVIQQAIDIDKVRVFHSTYCQYSSRYDAYLNKEVLPAFDPKFSGGALMDINVYNIHFAVSLFGKPNDVVYRANIGFNGIDTSGTVLLQYDGFQAVCVGAKDSVGTTGTDIQCIDCNIHIDSRPGHVRNIQQIDRISGAIKSLDQYVEDNPMAQQFKRIEQVIENHEIEQVNTWLEQSQIVIEILSEARKQVNVIFPTDV